VFYLESKGSFDKTERYLRNLSKLNIDDILKSCGQQGVNALKIATPVDTGLTSQSWGFEVKRTSGAVEIVWTNSDVENGFPVAIMLQYGHGTGTGGYVQGIDYINPAMKPVFDKIAETVWKAVTSA
jgi:hypothetical protein